MARRTNILKMTATRYKKKAKNAATQAVYMGLFGEEAPRAKKNPDRVTKATYH